MVQTQARKSTEKPKSSQLKLLAGAVKRKGAAGVKEVVKVQKVEQLQENGGKVGNGRANGGTRESPPSKEDGGGGGLLGLGDYGSDSDSD